jgi:hypothetical protein
MIKLKAFVKSSQIKSTKPTSKWVIEEKTIPKWVEIEEKIEEGKTVSFYVILYDDKGESYDDSLALTLEDAIQIAHIESGVKPEDWRIVEE